MKLLSGDEYNKVKDIFRQDSLFELNMNALLISEDNLTSLKSDILDIALTTKLYSLFTEGGFSLIVSKVFENIHLRDYLLGVSDRFSCNTAYLQTEDRLNCIEFTIAKGIASNYSNQHQYNITPEKIISNISVDFDIVYGVLVQNKWLLIVVLIVLFIEQVDQE